MTVVVLRGIHGYHRLDRRLKSSIPSTNHGDTMVHGGYMGFGAILATCGLNQAPLIKRSLELDIRMKVCRTIH